LAELPKSLELTSEQNSAARMNVTTLQRIDRWLGVPLCFALTLVRKIFDRSQPDNSQPPRNILFVKLAEQGSTMIA